MAAILLVYFSKEESFIFLSASNRAMLVAKVSPLTVLLILHSSVALLLKQFTEDGSLFIFAVCDRKKVEHDFSFVASSNGARFNRNEKRSLQRFLHEWDLWLR